MQWHTYDERTHGIWKDQLIQIEVASRMSFRDLKLPWVWIDRRRSDAEAIAIECRSSGLMPVLVLEAECRPQDVVLSDVWVGVISAPLRLSELLTLCRLVRLELIKNSVVQDQRAIGASHARLEVVHSILERVRETTRPDRFSGLKGVRVGARHVVGETSGGDFFDVFDSARVQATNIILADSSNYTVSSAFVGMLLGTGVKLAEETGVAVHTWVKAIQKELLSALGDEGALSIFLGRLSKRELTLDYQLYGSCEAFVVSPQGLVTRLKKTGPKIDSQTSFNDLPECSLQVQPKDRIIVVSDGLMQRLDGVRQLTKVITELANQEPTRLAEELAFQARKDWDSKDRKDDLSVLVVEVESRFLRLASNG
jgi:serine phosphatase RsbU (regulator of sigma subunit)